jgi:hypothetical protein
MVKFAAIALANIDLPQRRQKDAQMHAYIRYRLISLFAVLPLLLSAQPIRQRGPVPLKHWAAPLYWQAAPAKPSEGASAVQPNATGSPAVPSPLVFVAMPPCRIVDTRASSGFSGAFGPPSLVGNAVRTFLILSNTTCPLPMTAQAYSFEITVVPPGPLAYITAFPTGETNPVAAIAVESPQGLLVSNTGIIQGGTNGSVDVYASNPTDLVIDINGYYAAISNSFVGNTALGIGALANDPSGSGPNTAIGYYALSLNTTGTGNTATGANALQFNTTGNGNTATGNFALNSNTIGSANTAAGAHALSVNTSGNYNTAEGNNALNSNTTGGSNTATGTAALLANTTGSYNTAAGFYALYSSTTGNYNIAIGELAGYNLTMGSDNIYIGNQGIAGDNSTIYLGTQGTQTTTYVAGIYGTNVSGSPVYVTSTGQLGVQSSSRRYKQDISDMGDTTDVLMSLRPVRFHYKAEGRDGPEHYGLIAEEVAQVAPELVGHEEDGQIDSVYYEKVNAMLLKQVQTLQRLSDEQKERLQLQNQQLHTQGDFIRQLESRLTRLESEAR